MKNRMMANQIRGKEAGPSHSSRALIGRLRRYWHRCLRFGPVFCLIAQSASSSAALQPNGQPMAMLARALGIASPAAQPEVTRGLTRSVEAAEEAAGVAAPAGETLIVAQAECASVAPTRHYIVVEGGTISIGVLAASGCAWQASSNVSWLKITSNTSGTGNGVVTFSVAANTGPAPRSGTLTIAGKTVTISQYGSNLSPGIRLIMPRTVLVGGHEFTLQIVGSGFSRNSVVRWNGADRATRFISSTGLAATITAADIETAGSASVTVFNPSPGGGSNEKTLTITPLNLPWAQTPGPEGGHIQAIVSTGTNIFAGTQDGGIFRSTDQGRSWTAVNEGLPETEILALVETGGVLFAGTFFGGVFRSLDQGESWVAVNKGLEYAGFQLSIPALAVSGQNVYAAAASNGGVFRSTDLGESWTPINAGLSLQAPIQALAAVGSDLFAGMDLSHYTGMDQVGVYRWSSETQLWMPASNGLISRRVSSLAVVGTHLFAGTVYSGVFRSSDLGQSWAQVNNGLPFFTVDTAFAVSGERLYDGTLFSGVFVTTNLGQSWSPVGTDLTTTSVQSLAASGKDLFAGTDGGGVFRLAGLAGKWESTNIGLRVANVLALTTSGGNLLAGVPEGGVARSSDNGRTWIPINHGLTNRAVFSVAGNGATLFAGTNGGGIFRSTDNGENWAPANNGLPSLSIDVLAINGQTVFARFYGLLYRSTNNGESWGPTNAGLPQDLFVYDFAAIGSNLFVAAKTGVYRSTDNGGSWTSTSNGLPQSPIYSLAVMGNTLFAGTAAVDYYTPGGIYRSTDNGANWTRIKTSFSDLQGTGVSGLAVIGTKLVAVAIRSGVESNIYLSTDQGQTWNPINLGLPHYTPGPLAVNGTSLFMATYGGGVFVNELGSNQVASVSAASFRSATLAVESIVATFGNGLATDTQVAATLPLPTVLAGTQVLITDRLGVERPAPLFFVSPGQVNYQIPPGTALGPATVSVISGTGRISTGALQLVQTAPGLFAANANGQGVASAVVLRVRADGAQQFEPVAQFDAASNKLIPLPIDLGPESDQLFLVLFGTGFRYRQSLLSVSAKIGGAEAQVLAALAQPDFVGLDQVNLRVPRSLIGRGEVEVVLTVDGAAANTVKVSIR